MYQLMVASKSDLEIVFQLIEQRIELMNRVGIKQWNETNYCEVYPKTYYERLMRQGRLYVLKSNQTHRVIGAVACFDQDERWCDTKEVSAYYLHHLVTDYREKGVGHILLKEIEGVARKHKKHCLRLDCAMDNERLNQYYEEQGFLWCGQCEEGLYRGNLREKTLG